MIVNSDPSTNAKIINNIQAEHYYQSLKNIDLENKRDVLSWKSLIANH